MATTDPLTGATINDQGDAAVSGYQIGQAVTWLRRFIIPRFTTAANRDSAYTSAPATALVDGMVAAVAGQLQRRAGAAWTALVPPWITRLVGAANYQAIVSNTAWSPLFLVSGQTWSTTVDVPTAGQVEAEFAVPLAVAPANSGLQLRLKIGSAIVDSAYLSGDTAQVAGPLRMAGHMDYSVATSGVAVVIEALRVGTGNNPYVAALSGGTPPFLRTRTS